MGRRRPLGMVLVLVTACSGSPGSGARSTSTSGSVAPSTTTTTTMAVECSPALPPEFCAGFATAPTTLPATPETQTCLTYRSALDAISADVGSTTEFAAVFLDEGEGPLAQILRQSAQAIADSRRELASAGTPPDSFAAAAALFIEALDLYEDAYLLGAAAADANDASGLDLARERLDEAFDVWRESTGLQPPSC